MIRKTLTSLLLSVPLLCRAENPPAAEGRALPPQKTDLAMAQKPAAETAPPPAAPASKEPRKFLINGKLRPLRPGEVRPYVAPVLLPEPPPEPTDVQTIEVQEDEAQVLARPYYGAPMVGTVALGARLPVAGEFKARSPHYCASKRWFQLRPFGWICSKQGKPTPEPPTAESVLKVPAGERLPFRYVMVSSKEPLPMWASVEDLQNAEEPERMLQKGDSVAIQRAWKHDGEAYYVSVEGKVLPQKGTYRMAPPSEWKGLLLDDKVRLPFGWILPEKGKVYDAPQPGRKAVDTLPRRTRVEILEETEVGRKKYLRIKLADPPASPPSEEAMPGTPPQAEEPALWVLAADVNEVRRRPVPEGVNAVGKWIDIDLGEQVLVAYEGERPVYATLVASGRAVPTPMGNYPMWTKASAITMKSQPYDDKAYFVNKVPWALFFQAHNAIHGAYWHDRFGTTKSHGCANVAPLDARYLFEWMPPALPPGWSSVRPVDLRESVTVHVYNSHLARPFRQERPVGPPDRDDEAERLEAAERRRAEEAARAEAAALVKPPAASPAPAPAPPTK